MVFNVITPLARYNNINELVNHLEPKNIKWHVITDIDSNDEFTITKDWVNHYVCPNEGNEFWARCNNSINWFIENFDLNDDEYYGILNDDDGYEDLFFKKLREGIDDVNKSNGFTDLVICSMLRGHNTPGDAEPVRQHPTFPLIARPESMNVGGVGVEQFFVKGSILKNHRLPLTTCGDGELISELVKTYGATYLPDTYVWFNYFEPGRWNK
jgi:hypothetical protein